MPKKVERLSIFKERIALMLSQYVASTKLTIRSEIEGGRSAESLKELHAGKMSIFSAQREKLSKEMKKEAGRLIYELYVKAWMDKLRNA